MFPSNLIETGAVVNGGELVAAADADDDDGIVAAETVFDFPISVFFSSEITDKFIVCNPGLAVTVAPPVVGTLLAVSLDVVSSSAFNRFLFSK